ncbi:hypothetical protein F5877DRAFT_72512 [Lentinula edodes]|nr:hypothetical protein F5877DRAFT_72512 [Lentinula edodes]
MRRFEEVDVRCISHVNIPEVRVHLRARALSIQYAVEESGDRDARRLEVSASTSEPLITEGLSGCQGALPSIASVRGPVVPAEDFTDNPVDVDILHRQRLFRFQIPHENTVARLRVLAIEMVAKGAKSVRYAHIPGEKTSYPIWVVELWAKLISLQEQQAPWTDVERWLQSQALRDEDVEQVKAVLAVMGTVPYEMKKALFSDGKPIHDLWRLLGDKWTSSILTTCSMFSGSR